MKYKFADYAVIFLITVFGLIICACSRVNTKTVVFSNATRTEDLQQISQATGTPSAEDTPGLSLPTPTQTRVVATNLPRPSSTLVSTPPPVPTPTLGPTLTTNQAIETIMALVQGDPSCELPCLWNITPEKTTLQEALQQFRRLGFRLDNRQLGLQLVLHSGSISQLKSIDTDNIRVFVVEDSSQVDTLKIAWAGVLGKRFQEAWTPYGLDAILAKYGKPTRIMITPLGSPDAMAYTLWLEYEDQGVLFSYTGYTEWRVGSANSLAFRVCPLWSYDQVDGGSISVKLPNNSMPWNSYIEEYEKDVPYMRSIEEVTSLSTDQFYDLFTSKPHSACFDVFVPKFE